MQSPKTRWWLDRVELERFKAASHADIQLEPFTVIIGRNGSGKSTLLEALQWLDTAIRRDVREACDRYYGVHDLINKRYQEKNPTPYFGLHLQWQSQQELPPPGAAIQSGNQRRARPAAPRIIREPAPLRT